MWKKRLIIFVTFISGLYFFLEFVVPPTIPWATTRGVVRSVETREVGHVQETAKGKIKNFTADIEIGLVRSTGSVFITEKTRDKITRINNLGKTENTSSEGIKPGDLVTVISPTGGELHGIVMPSSSPRRVEVGKVIETKTLSVNYTEKYDKKDKDKKAKPVDSWIDGKLIRRLKSKDAGEEVMPSNLVSGIDKSADWVAIGPTTYLTGMLEDITDFFAVLGAMAWGMGLLSLWMVNSATIRKRRPEWYTSIIFFVSVGIGMLAATGLYSPKELGWWVWTSGLNDVILWEVMNPLGSTVFSLLTFYLASSAYRSFKAKSYEGTLMMVSAVIVMLGQVSLNMYVNSASTWILYIVNNAAVRGMWFGMMLGGIAVGLRMWLSLERGAFFDGEL